MGEALHTYWKDEADRLRRAMNLQVIASPDGDILWVSGALPRSVHDKKAEWIWGVLDKLQAAGTGYRLVRGRAFNRSYVLIRRCELARPSAQHPGKKDRRAPSLVGDRLKFPMESTLVSKFSAFAGNGEVPLG